jgi:hypothetical protein
MKCFSGVNAHQNQDFLLGGVCRRRWGCIDILERDSVICLEALHDLDACGWRPNFEMPFGSFVMLVVG